MAQKEEEANQQPQQVKLNIGGQIVNATVSEDGTVIIPDTKSEVVAKALGVIEHAGGILQGTQDGGLLKDSGKEEGENENEKEKENNSTANAFKGLPMSELIGAPLFAAAEAQQKLAAITLDYFNRVGFEPADDGKESKTRVLKFHLNRPIEQDGVMTQVQQTVEAPFLGLVPAPSLLIDNIDVDFQMEVTDTNTSKKQDNTEANASVSAKWFAVQAEMSAKVSSSRESTRTTNQTAKYQVHVRASQQPQTEGLSKLMDIMASCIEPMQKKD